MPSPLTPGHFPGNSRCWVGLRRHFVANRGQSSLLSLGNVDGLWGSQIASPPNRLMMPLFRTESHVAAGVTYRHVFDS